MKTRLAPTGVLKPTVVTQYINRAVGMRTKKDAVAKLIAAFDAVLAAVVVEARNLAR